MILVIGEDLIKCDGWRKIPGELNGQADFKEEAKFRHPGTAAGTPKFTRETIKHGALRGIGNPESG